MNSQIFKTPIPLSLFSTFSRDKWKKNIQINVYFQKPLLKKGTII